MSRNTAESQLRHLIRGLLREDLRDFKPSDDPELAAAIERDRDFSGWHYMSSADHMRNEFIKVDDEGEIWKLPHGMKPPGGSHWNRETKSWEAGQVWWQRVGKPHTWDMGSWQKLPLLTVDPSELESDELGQYAFAPQRKGGPIEVPFEENTRAEQYLYDALVDMTKQNRKVTPDIFNFMERLTKSGKYPDVFEVLDPSTPIYRGMLVGEKQLIPMIDKLGLDGKAEIEKARKGRKVTVDGLSWGRPGEAASWTLSKKRATDFARAPAGSGGKQPFAVTGMKYSILIESTIAAAPKYISFGNIYKLNRHIGGFEDEMEVVVSGVVPGTTTTVLPLE